MYLLYNENNERKVIMGRKNPEHFIYKEELLKRLQDFGQNETSLKLLGKDELVWLAFENSLISDVERDASFNKITSTLPCYLHTHIIDTDIQEKIEEYVQAYSMLYSRGTYLANLVAIQKSKSVQKHFPKETIPIPTFLLDENVLKTCFLPERWLERSTPKALSDDIQNTYYAYKDVLDYFLPAYKTVLPNTGWDNAINHMGTLYLGNIKVMILSNLEKRLKTYLYDTHELKSTTDRHEFVKNVCYTLYPSSKIHQDDFEWISNFRNFACLSIHNCFYSIVEDLTDITWTLHHWLQNSLNYNDKKSFSLLPVSSIGRTYSYIDSKIINSLLNIKIRRRMLERTMNHKGSELQKVLGLTSTLFNKRRQSIRNKLKNKYKKSKSKVLKRKWEKIGHGCLPSTAIVKTISTDGVGLRICLEFIPKINPNQKKIKQLEKPLDTVAIGWDTGRVRIITSADETGKVVIVKRKSYYNAQRTKQFRAWEDFRKTGTCWGAALSSVAQAGGFKNNDINKWTSSLNAMAKNITVYKNELLVQKDYALWKMRRFRWKKAFFDHKIKQIIMPSISKNKKVHIGIGDGSFSHTGKGEISVPTTSIKNKLKRVVRMMKIEGKVDMSNINEYKTTKCCYKCDSEMHILVNKAGNDCLRYRLCTGCSTKTYGKRRNRDVNAAKNMLRLLRLEMDGCPRPLHLTYKPLEKHHARAAPICKNCCVW